jgi:hypothetical protein
LYNYGSNFSENSSSAGDGYLCSVVDVSINDDLRRVDVSAGYDTDGDGTLEAGEVEVELSTLIAARWTQ